MDFIIGLPKMTKQNDSIMIIVEKLAKLAHFIPIKSTYNVKDIATIFMRNVFTLHGFPKAIISN